MDPLKLKNLKINLGAVKRLLKERDLYKQEFQQYSVEVSTSEYDTDTYEYKNLVAMKNEAEVMIQDTEQRITDFSKRLMSAYRAVEEFRGDTTVEDARTVLASISDSTVEL